MRDPVHIRDLNATILHALGIDHTRLTVKYQGLDLRLTGVDQVAEPIWPILGRAPVVIHRAYALRT